jgi:hypothetical protein
VIAALRERFVRDGFADISALIPPDVRARTSAEVTAALDAHSIRRDVRIAVTGGTPRRYRVVDRDTLASACADTAELYRSPHLLGLVSAIAGQSAVPVPYVAEELIATRLERAGDTHGWHWDDYAFALVWVLCAPAAHDGATLEYITGVPWCKADPDVEGILAEREPVRAYIPSGTLYLLRTDTTLHRVTPLARDVRRDALCFSYAAGADIHRTVTHESLETILTGT